MSTCKPVNSPVALDSIIKHADLSRYMAPGLMAGGLSPKADAHAARLRPHAAGLERLRGLRIAWACWKRARANAIEDAPHAARIEARYGPGAAWDAGLSVGVPPKPAADLAMRRVREALDAGLPPELADLCLRWFAQQA
jgi:hypothetical protein